ncbi:MAG: TIGR03032 family protein [Deltaproteobacteria bacterium]|nr:TIGR03032 family protein [Deltaproteobacteria bacterium]
MAPDKAAGDAQPGGSAQEGQENSPENGQPRLSIDVSRQFTSWLNEIGSSIAFTTYQAGKLFMVGLGNDGKLSVFERSLPRCMGMTVNGNSIFVSSLYQLWRFENALKPGELHDGYDRVFVPQMGFITGDLDIHDMVVTREGRLVFVNTLFSCLGTPSPTHSFVPVWKPPFISKLAAEDRCHMNGLAMVDGLPRYVSAVSESDVVDGWRNHRNDGGVIMDIQTNETVARGLSMPHSPRFHDGKLWVHNSGSGHFGFIDMDKKAFEPLTFCPGYLRGLSFIRHFAVVGLSKIRKNKSFTGLELDNQLEKRKAETRCAVYIIDTRNGDIVHWLQLEGVVEELYDVAVLPGAKRPMAIGFISDEIRRIITVGEPA